MIGVPQKIVIPPIGFGISQFTVLREEQKEKQKSSKRVTEDGILMDVREEQPLKHPFPKLVTEDGILMDVREEQP